LNELKDKGLNHNVVAFINACVDDLNTSTFEGNKLIQFAIQKQSDILKQIEKEHKIVPKNHYRNIWGLAGMTIWGLYKLGILCPNICIMFHHDGTVFGK
jgi:hypothetical protein